MAVSKQRWQHSRLDVESRLAAAQLCTQTGCDQRHGSNSASRRFPQHQRLTLSFSTSYGGSSGLNTGRSAPKPLGTMALNFGSAGESYSQVSTLAGATYVDADLAPSKPARWLARVL